MAYPNHNFVNGETKLVFDKVGDQYFLKEIVSTSVRIALPMSDFEKKAQMARGRVNSGTKTVTP